MSNTTAKLMQLIHDMGVISERMDAKDKRIAELEGALKQYAEQTVNHPNVARIALEPKGGDDE